MAADSPLIHKVPASPVFTSPPSASTMRAVRRSHATAAYGSRPSSERDFAALRTHFPAHHDGVRSVIKIAVERIADSCGYGVPQYQYVAERSQLPAWVQKKGPDGLVQYRAERNRTSIDGLPGLRV